MHSEILSQAQINQLPILAAFKKDFGLVGGTAIALNIGHRRSIDFDLFTEKELDNRKIRKKIVALGRKIEIVLRDEPDEYTVLINGVQFTFYHYPFPLMLNKKYKDIIRLPDLLTLAAMKAHALGRRAKWKDYVDLYFIMENFHDLQEINNRAKKLFKSEYEEKLFRMQLAYFKDIDYSEKVIYLKGKKISDNIIRETLKKVSLE